MTAPHPAQDNILVIKLGALGDFIQALGPMAAIRAHHPHDTITLLTTPPFEALARDCGYADNVWARTRPKWHDIKGWLNLRKDLNGGKFKRVYDLQNNDRTALYFKLFKPVPEWSGAAPGASLRNASPDRSIGKAFYGHVQTLAIAGITGIVPDTLSWMKGRTDFPGLRAPYILIVPGGSPKHPEKRWPPSYFAALCAKAAAAGYQPVILGAKAEEGIAAEIAASAPGALNLAGQTGFYDIAALARGAAAALGNDTGPMHIIAPTGCKSIVLFSAVSQPNRHAPLGAHVATIQEADLKKLSADAVWSVLKDQLASL